MTGSPYTVETGPGYEGVLGVSSGSIEIGMAMCDAVDWDCDTPLAYVPEPDGLRVTPHPPAGSELLDIPGKVSRTNRNRHSVTVPLGALSAVGLGNGDDVRIYAHDDGGLLLVDAEDDPRVPGGDGA